MIETLFNILSHDRIQRVDSHQESNKKSESKFSDHLKSDEPKKIDRDDRSVEKHQENNIDRSEKTEAKQPKENSDNKTSASENNPKDSSSEKTEQSSDTSQKSDKAETSLSEQSEKVEYKSLNLSSEVNEIIDGADKIDLASLTDADSAQLKAGAELNTEGQINLEGSLEGAGDLNGSEGDVGAKAQLLSNQVNQQDIRDLSKSVNQNNVQIDAETVVGPTALANLNQESAKSAIQAPTGLELSQKAEVNISPTAQTLKNIQREIQGASNQNNSNDLFNAAAGDNIDGILSEQQVFQDFVSTQDQASDQEALGKFKFGDLQNLGRFSNIANTPQNLQNNNLVNSASPQAMQIGQSQLSSNALNAVSANASNQQNNAVPLNSLGVHIASQARAGNKRFDIRLDPPDLGRIDVRLDVGRDGAVNTHIVVERSETLDLLQRDSKALERAINDAGLDLKDGNLNFSLKDQSFAENMQDQDASEQLSEEQDNDEIPVEQQISNLANIPLQDGSVLGLDIRV